MDDHHGHHDMGGEPGGGPAMNDAHNGHAYPPDQGRVAEALACLEATENQPNLPAVCGMLIAQAAMV